LIAEQSGSTYIMPGGVTPVFLAGISTGNRTVVHTYFTLTDSTLNWEWMDNLATSISVSQEQTTNITTQPQITAMVSNSSVADINNVSFVVVPFDTAGNAINASETIVSDLRGDSSAQIGFTWPEPFTVAVSHIDIVPLVPPVPDKAAQK
ncbi:MAG TPA: hypothetical protein VMU27_00615, partial [Candidatus Paceibacterota bacterium]|nr:hypothetical protein [Candidatus Paceibacterota bacterium]